MELFKTLNTVALENTYYLVNEQAALVIDPGSNGEEILATLQKINKPVAAILLTHTHYDHIMSLDLVREKYNHPPVYVSEKEASWLTSPKDNLSGLPRHDDMEDVVAAPADFIFIMKRNTLSAVFNLRSLKLQDTHGEEYLLFFKKQKWSFQGMPFSEKLSAAQTYQPVTMTN